METTRGRAQADAEWGPTNWHSAWRALFWSCAILLAINSFLWIWDYTFAFTVGLNSASHSFTLHYRTLFWGELLSVGIFALGAAFVGFAVAPSLGLACVASLIGGIGNGLEWPSVISLVQRMTPQHLLGRLMGAVESLGAMCLAIGLPLGGILVAISSARTAFLVVGLGTAATTVAFLRLMRTGPERGNDPIAPGPSGAGSPDQTVMPAQSEPSIG